MIKKALSNVSKWLTPGILILTVLFADISFTLYRGNSPGITPSPVKLLISKSFSGHFFKIDSALLRSLHAQSVPEFQWPLIRGEYPELRGLSSTFGESRMDRFHTGLDVAGQGQAIYPAAAGEILYTRKISDHPFQPIPGAGNSVFIDHDNGWWSGYFHLENLGEDLSERNGYIGKDNVIGTAGNTGRSMGPHLHLFLAKNYGKSYVNPLNYLPPAKDNHPPVIGELIIATPQGQTTIPHSRMNQNIRLTQPYPFYLRAHDPGLERFSRRGLYRLSWQMNDGPEHERIFNEIVYTESGWLLEGSYPFEDVFYESYYNLGIMEIRNGANELKVTGIDHAGNSTTVTFHINIRREY